MTSMEKKQDTIQAIVKLTNEQFENCLVSLFEWKENPKLVRSILIIRKEKH